jgi:hypothetical protein
MLFRSFAAALLALALAACGGDGGDEAERSAADAFEQSFSGVEAYPLLVSSELVVGQNRFVVGLLDDNDAPVADPRIQMTVDFYDISGAEPVKSSSSEMQWVWIEKGLRGYYIGNATFEKAGEWGVEIRVAGSGIDEELRSKATVAEESSTPALGEWPPPSDTPTLEDVENLSQISTDTTPVERFYRYSIAEALQQRRPTVVVFATPKFCTSAVCAPTLDRVQDVADEFPKVSFVHVEPYELDQLPDEFVPVRAMTQWGLPSEPWVFVMDSSGRVVAKYEGVMGPDELREALRQSV